MPNALFTDVKLAWRLLRRSPGLTAVSVLVLGLSLGASLTLFGLLDALVLRTLPVDRPDRLIAIAGYAAERPLEGNHLPVSALDPLASLDGQFTGVSGYVSSGVTALTQNIPSQVGLDGVSGSYFGVLGVRPSSGRLLTSNDVRTEAAVAVVSFDFWQKELGASTHVIGLEIRLAGTPFEIVGVTQSDYHGLNVGFPTDVTIPITRIGHVFGIPSTSPLPLARAIARLRNGVSLPQARASLEAVWPEILKGLVAPTPEEAQQLLALQLDVRSAATGFSYLRDWYEKPLNLLSISSVWLLLIACTNLAGLSLARVRVRGQEMRVRLALGASRLRLLQQLLTETVLLSVVGTVVSLPLALVASREILFIMWGNPSQLPLDLTPRLTGVLAVIASVLGTGLVVGLVPAWRASRTSPIATMSTFRIVGGGKPRWSEGLLVAQVALAVVLLVGAGLFTKNLWKLRVTQTGFHAQGVSLAELDAQPSGYANLDVFAYCRQLVDRLTDVSGVRSVALSNVEPVMGLEAGEEKWLVTPPGSTAAAIETTIVAVSPEFFQTMGVPILRGRDINWTDDSQHRPVVIVSASLAAALFAHADSIGQQLQIGTGRPHRNVEVVGVTADAHLADLHAREPRFAFVPILQEPRVSVRSPTVLIRSNQSLSAIEPNVARIVQALGQDYVVRQRTLAAQVDRSLLRERLLVIGATYFGALAAAIVAVGLVGVLSHAVTRRTREMGIRGVLGASPGALRSMIVRQSLRVVMLGLLIGLPCAWGVTQVFGASLTDMSPHDPLVFMAATAVSVVVTLCAAWVPAQRASRIRPADALRVE